MYTAIHLHLITFIPSKTKQTLNVSASCGIGPNKLFARLASTAAGAKPNGQGILPPDPLAIDEVRAAE